MANDPTYRLGDLQLRIMQVLWTNTPLSVGDVQRQLDGEPLAYTTVATMLRKMEGRGLVRHRQVGRRFMYEPAVTADDVSRSMSNEFVDRLFAGSLSAAVYHLLETRDVDRRELDQLESLIRARKK